MVKKYRDRLGRNRVAGDLNGLLQTHLQTHETRVTLYILVWN